MFIQKSNDVFMIHLNLIQLIDLKEDILLNILKTKTIIKPIEFCFFKTNKFYSRKVN
jgi:hypothetical protein